MKKERRYLPAAVEAAQALGLQIAAARRELGWTAEELAGRIGVTVATLRRIERGSPSTTLGTVLEAAVVCGVPLFGPDARDISRASDQAQARLALLPDRVRVRRVELDNDF